MHALVWIGLGIVAGRVLTGETPHQAVKRTLQFRATPAEDESPENGNGNGNDSELAAIAG